MKHAYNIYCFLRAAKLKRSWLPGFITWFLRVPPVDMNFDGVRGK
jgi:hypothetical protein